MDSGSIDWGSTPHGCTHFIFFHNMRVQGEVIRDALFFYFYPIEDDALYF